MSFISINRKEVWNAHSDLSYFPKGTIQNKSRKSKDVIIRLGRIVIVISIFEKVKEGK